MKVLHLPFNIASQASTTVVALRQLGVEARGLVRSVSVIQSHEGIEAVEWTGKPPPLARLIRGVRWRTRMLRAFAWADVVHWHFGDSTWKGLDLRAVAWMGKPALVEFWGDDLRDPKLASRDNPFIASMYEQHPELMRVESGVRQAAFRKHGFEPLIPGYELADYLDPSLFPGYYQTRQRLALESYAPSFPAIVTSRPLLVHAPSDRARKGTEAVLRAVERLSVTHSFEFKLIQGMARNEALKLYQECDLFVDQFTVGAEGLAAHEAMALGKPVVCFIKDSIKARYPATFPVVSADQNSLESVLSSLIRDGARRRDLGIKGRQYVEAHNDARKVAGELIEIYRELLARKQSPDTARGRYWRPLKSNNGESN